MLNFVIRRRDALLVALTVALIAFTIGSLPLPASSSDGLYPNADYSLHPVATPTTPYQNPTTPYQNPASPYQNQNPTTPYQNPASPYQQPSAIPTNASSGITSPPTQQSLPTLIVLTRVNGTSGVGGNAKDTANFSQVVTNAYSNPDGYTYSYHFMRGSQIGVTLNLEPGIFAVYEPVNNSSKLGSSYATTYSGDCANVKSTISSAAGSSGVYGYGVIRPGESKTCIVTNSVGKK